MLSFISLRVKLRMIPASRLAINMKRCHSTFSLSDYDCIGFDLDHTLAAYQQRPLHDLIASTLASWILQEPSTLEPSSLQQKGIVLDKRRGNFLKLDVGHRIVAATHGTRVMSHEEVECVYGPQRTFEKDIPSRLAQGIVSELPFYVFKDAFTTPGITICSQLVDHIDSKNNGPKAEYSFFDDYLGCLHKMYDRENFNSGGFFPEMRAHPERYLVKCSEDMKQWLQDLRKTKRTFVVTSANHDAADLVAGYCLGKGWRDMFDLVVTFARKPGFFYETRPYKLMPHKSIAGTPTGSDTACSEVKSETMVPPIGSNTIISEGNFRGLRSAFGTDRILYCGDSLIEDIFAGRMGGKCDTVAIVEEMEREDVGHFGSFFTVGGGLSLWADVIAEHSRIAVPNLETLTHLKEEDRISAFNGQRLQGIIQMCQKHSRKLPRTLFFKKNWL